MSEHMIPIPKRLGSARKFKARKRYELAELERALTVVQTGCAFAPIRNLDQVMNQIRAWRHAASVKEWGR